MLQMLYTLHGRKYDHLIEFKQLGMRFLIPFIKLDKNKIHNTGKIYSCADKTSIDLAEEPVFANQNIKPFPPSKLNI